MIDTILNLNGALFQLIAGIITIIVFFVYAQTH